MKTVFLLVGVASGLCAAADAFRVCGHFCGPNWCNDGKFSEWNADSNHCGPNYMEPEADGNGVSCADACCKAHDQCCSPGGDDLPSSLLLTSGCNDKIVDCLGRCSAFDSSCTAGFLPVPASTVWAAMDMVKGWCCGHRCPSQVDGHRALTTIEKEEAAEVRAVGVAEETVATAPYLVSTAYSDDTCNSERLNRVAMVCNQCNALNESLSARLVCEDNDCAEEAYYNRDCSGPPVVRKALPCDDKCDEEKARGKTMGYFVGEVTSGVDLKEWNYPILKTYATATCTGAVSTYAEMGGCKPAGVGHSFNRLCRNKTAFACEYKDDACKTEMACQKLRNTPGVCQNMSRNVVVASEVWACE